MIAWWWYIRGAVCTECVSYASSDICILVRDLVSVITWYVLIRDGLDMR